MTGASLAALVVTVATGAPRSLPDMALSSTVLFHLERATVLFAVVVFVLVILVRAWRGELPSEMSGQGFKYASPEETSDAASALAAAAGRLHTLIDRIERPE